MDANEFKQVLLVDDDPEFAYLVQTALLDCQIPCNLKTLSSGTELLDWLETNRRPSMIFMDIAMPIISGFSILKLLKATANYKMIPVVMLSVSDYQDDVDESYDIGASGYIIKPMKFDHLVQRMAAFSHYWLDVIQEPGSLRFRPDDTSQYN